VLESPGQKRQVVLQSRPVLIDRPRQRLHFRLNTLYLTDYGYYVLSVEFSREEKWETAARLPVLIRPVD
jgi:hypothetical protein